MKATMPSAAVNGSGMLSLWIMGGIAYPAIALVTPYIGGTALTCVRTLGASALAFGFAYLGKRRKLTRREILWNAVLGVLLYSVSMTLLAFASVHLPASLLAVGFACMPLILMVWNWVDGIPPSMFMVLGFFIAFAGLISIVAAPGMTLVSANPVLGWSLLAGSVFVWTYGLRLWVTKIRTAEPIRSAAVQLASGGLVLLPFVMWIGFSSFSLAPPVIIWLVYLVVSQAVTHIAYVGLSGRTSPTLLSTFTLINPAVAAIAGYFMLDQSLTWRMNIGVLLALVGTTLVMRAELSQRLTSSFSRGVSTERRRLQGRLPERSK